MAHTSCMSEAQKYQGHLYRPEKEKKGNNRQPQAQNQNNSKQNQQQGYNHAQSQSKAVQPYVEEEVENRVALVETMPEAPTPPSAVPDFEPTTEKKPNVFDFYAGQATPNASTADLTKFATAATAVVKFSEKTVEAVTPAPKKSKKSKDETKSDKKSDKKRKRLHVDTSGNSSVDRDLEMPDADNDGSGVPGLHTGLTGGLKQLMPRDGFFPPTPDLSGDAETPIKRKKSEKKEKKEIGLMARMGTGLINSAVGRRTSSRSSGKNAEDGPRKKTKAIEYKTSTNEDANAAVIPFAPALEPEAMAAQLMAFVPAAEESEKGVSMDKALKRYHRMRSEAGGAGKAVEEKELWKALRMKRNERGEIVLFFTSA